MSELSWVDANQRLLTQELAGVRALLEAQARRQAGDAVAQEVAASTKGTEEAAPDEMAPTALDGLSEVFALSRFERQLLLLCAGVELDGGFAALCAAAHGDPIRAYPTFGLALAVLPDAHWSALLPTAALRYWRLVHVGAGMALTTSPLRVDEKILHYLAGISHLDDGLIGIVELLAAASDELVPSHAKLAERMGSAWARASDGSPLPLLQLCGNDRADIRAIATNASAAANLRLHRLAAADIPADPRELETLALLWERESALNPVALLVECDVTPAAEAHAVKFIERLRSPLVVSCPDRLPQLQRPVLTLDVNRPTRTEQAGLWQTGLPKAQGGVDDAIGPLVSQFDLSARGVRAVCTSAMLAAPTPGALASELWDLCRADTRPRLDALAQHIQPVAGWDDLILPKAQKEVLHDIARHVRHRARVYDDWGFAAASSRGLGISALFEGVSGTGKSMAAEVLARELRLDLFRIDLSQVVSKYIGETEKNLRQVFDAAESGGAILLFDEADALFGKRTEIKDSHDRYANIEVSYLLQRMEAYRGLAILTTNMKAALDPAFLRRIRFVVQFPFPDALHRAEIWRQVFPASTPTQALDVDKLARLNVTGGNIRNIALNAAFLAADDGGQVGMAHLLQAARSEYAKLERPLSAAEIGNWT